MSGQQEIIDMMDPTYRSMICALRSRQYFAVLDTIYKKMDLISKEFLNENGGSAHTGLYLENTFKSPAFKYIWQSISLLYKENMAPINPSKRSSEDDDKYLDRVKQDLVSTIKAVNANPDLIKPDVLSFYEFANDRYLCDLEQDWKLSFYHLKTNAEWLADQYSMVDLKLQQSDSAAALQRRQQRCAELRGLFVVSRGGQTQGGDASIIQGLKSVMKDTRLHTYAGGGERGFDDPIRGTGGLHAVGLSMIIAPTGGCKTLVKTSIVGNMIYQRCVIEKREAPVIWGYIGEDSNLAIFKRIMMNLMNRKEFAEINGQVTHATFEREIVKAGSAVETAATYINEHFLKNLFLIRSPGEIRQKLAWNIMNILDSFDAQMEVAGVKPELIFIDYFNLLRMPKGESEGIQSRDLTVIANIVDDWAEIRGIAVISSVQANSDSAKNAREHMRLIEIEDMSEAKHIADSCRLVLSILPHTSLYDEKGNTLEYTMAIKVVKNRNGNEGQIFTSLLDKACNVGFIGTKLLSIADWDAHKGAIAVQRAAFDTADFSNKKNKSQGQRQAPVQGQGQRAQPKSSGFSTPSPLHQPSVQMKTPSGLKSFDPNLALVKSEPETKAWDGEE